MRYVAVIAAVLAAGCYNYNPLTRPSPEPGSSVAVTLTGAGTQDLARYLGPDVLLVRGRYVGDDERGLVVSVAAVELIRGDEIGWAGENVTVPHDDIAAVRVRSLSRGKSILLVGAGVTGLVATTAAFAMSGGGTAGGASGGPPGKQ